MGKSTLLAILAGVLKANEGEVALGGRLLWMPQDVGMREEERPSGRC